MSTVRVVTTRARTADVALYASTGYFGLGAAACRPLRELVALTTTPSNTML